jgi:nucleotide-binding universal stress UspA family protein
MNTHTFDARAGGPVVVGTDGSAGAERAVLWAAKETALRNQTLTIVHATDIEPLAERLSSDAVWRAVEAAQSLVGEAAKLASDQVPGLRVTTAVSREPAPTSLLHAAGEDGTIVVGSRGLGGFSALLLGSVGLKVVSRASGPVVVVRGTERPETRIVVVGVQDEDDLDVVRFAAETARRRRASLRLLSAWTYIEYLESMAPMADAVRAAAEAEAAACTRMLGPVQEEFPDLTVRESVARVPSPAGELVAASSQADLVVVGGSRPARRLGALMGRVTHAVLQHAHCPVAVVPHQ